MLTGRGALVAATPRPRAWTTRWPVFSVLAVAVLWMLASSLFTVDVTEYGIVTRFGRVSRVVAEAGLHAKLPVDRVIRLDKRLLLFVGAPAEYLTEDKKNVVAQSVATWRIADPERFLASVATRQSADQKLADAVVAETGSILGRYPAATLISASGERQYGRLADEIAAHVGQYARAAYGIEILDVRMPTLSLPDQNKPSVFERMKAERGKMAMQHRSLGEREARTIIAQAERERTRIDAEAYAEAARLDAEGEAEAIRLYGEAMGQDENFYKFMRTLEAYRKVLDGRTTIFLPANAELLSVLSSHAGERRGGAKPDPDPGDDLAGAPWSQFPASDPHAEETPVLQGSSR
jgi:modulator of FtsH protease HflC